MMRLNANQVADRSSKAFARKDLWRSIYEDCYRYALPQRNLYDGYYEGSIPGQNKMNMVFDSTAIHSTQRFANRIQSGLFPPYKKWCRLEPGDDIPPERRAEVQQALDIYLEKFFTVLRQSNFDLAIGEFLLDLCVGTAVMLVQEGDDTAPITFTSVPQYLVALEEGPNGTVDNVYRKYKIRAEAISRQFPDAVLPDSLQRLINDKPQETVELIEATIIDPERKDYCYHVIYEKTKEELLMRRMDTTPWVVSRYMKVAGEDFGRGPLVSAIPDIKTLNKTLELLLKNASIACAGVYTAADDGVINPSNIRITPGSIIPVARNGGPQGASLAPLPRSGDFNVSQIVINDLRMSIKKTLLDDTLPPDNMSARSATEIVERMKELAQNMGSAFGRLITETMTPIVAKVLNIMDKKGLIELPLKVNGLEVKIIPISPLAKAQNLEEINEIMQFVQIAGSLGPGGIAEMKPDLIATYIGDKLGIPSSLRTTPEEKQQIIQQSMQMAQMQQQQMQGGMPPEGGPPMEGPPQEGPPMEEPSGALEQEVSA
jgi:hypothetical protein|tara:strand:+ start:140 stop:1768 length:1629 start_codon:yes stop_codon:yes gene_type:complete